MLEPLYLQMPFSARLDKKQEATSNKCIASSNKCLTSSNKKLLETGRFSFPKNLVIRLEAMEAVATRVEAIATSNKGIATSSSKPNLARLVIETTSRAAGVFRPT